MSQIKDSIKSLLIALCYNISNVIHYNYIIICDEKKWTNCPILVILIDLILYKSDTNLICKVHWMLFNYCTQTIDVLAPVWWHLGAYLIFLASYLKWHDLIRHITTVIWSEIVEWRGSVYIRLYHVYIEWKHTNPLFIQDMVSTTELTS